MLSWEVSFLLYLLDNDNVISTRERFLVYPDTNAWQTIASSPVHIQKEGLNFAHCFLKDFLTTQERNILVPRGYIAREVQGMGALEVDHHFELCFCS